MTYIMCKYVRRARLLNDQWQLMISIDTTFKDPWFGEGGDIKDPWPGEVGVTLGTEGGHLSTSIRPGTSVIRMMMS